MKKQKHFRQHITISLVYRFVRTLILTTVLFCIALLTLYTIGNYQNFQDESQQLILNTISYVSIFTLLLTIPVNVENILHIITKHHKLRYIISILLMLLTDVFCLFCLTISSIIDYLSIGFF